MLVGLVIGRYPTERYSMHRGYLDALRALDATPMIVPAGDGLDADAAAEILAGCDALVSTGGGDIDPAAYGADPTPELMEVDADRDVVDLWAVRDFHARGRPVLGICRGAQSVAVAMGGTLVVDLPSAGITGHWDEARQYEPIHGIEADPGSEAAAALGGTTEVNSIHHQAIADPGPNLRVTARGPGDVIEAVETEGVLAVQWHPERLYFGGDARHLAPFEWLVKRA